MRGGVTLRINKYNLLRVSEQVSKERIARIEEIKEALNELDKKRIRAMCEPSEYSKGLSWLEYYNEQAQTLRTELQMLEERIKNGSTNQ